MTTLGEPALAPRDTADVCDFVRASAELDRPLRIVGGGTWLDAGRPVRDATRLQLAALSGVIEYVPGDLTITARAGTPIAALQRVVGAHGQWVPLDAIGDERTTLGGALATAAYGALSATVGRPRDVTLGLELVTGEGRIVRGGGRVVKNVAGFDLVRLNVGAWGTLGVITEATVRLRALPISEATIAVALSSDVPSLTSQIDGLRRALLTPLAMELVNSVLASHLDVATDAVVLVRVAGNDESVQAQRAVLESLGDTRELSSDVWSRLQRADPQRSASLRLSRRPSELANIWLAATAACASLRDVQLHGNVERGIVRLVVPVENSSDVQSLLSELQRIGTVVGERLPDECWDSVGGDFASPLGVNARRAFDPSAILNRGLVAPHV